MKSPKIIFAYSKVYDKTLNNLIEKSGDSATSTDPSISPMEYITKIGEEWEKISENVFNEISYILNLDWKEEKIKCYLIRKGICFSDPLTIKYFKDTKRFLEVLSHELIHIILTQNIEKTQGGIKKLNEIYSDLTQKARTHIIVHAVLKKVLEKHLGKNSLERDIKLVSKIEDYKKAWDIVLEKGENNIIKKFVENYSK
jgi:hypothetical protein